MIRRGAYIILCFLGIVSFTLLPVTHAHADLAACSANISPVFVTPSSDNGLILGVSNLSSTPIYWLRFVSPGGQYFSVVSASAYQWQGDVSGDSAVFTQGMINANQSQNFTVEVLASETATSAPVSWAVEASDDPAGTNFIRCDGDTSISIAPEPSQISIWDVGIGSIDSDNVTIRWTTDIASTSQVYYGLDGSYGYTTKLDTSLTNNHNVAIANLTPNTGYHFQVISTTPDGGTVSSQDSTFLTAVKQPTKVILVPSASNPLSGVINFEISNPKDKVPPTISLSSTLSKVVTAIPKISGLATDDLGVERIEYSTDGGINWLPVDNAPLLGGKQVVFSFTPTNLDDGKYEVLARAIDGGGNITATPAVTQIVDRLPPLVGGDVINVGPQVLEANKDGIIETTVGINQKITVSAVGGPSSITLTSTDLTAGKTSKQFFSLTRSATTNLWSGVLSFAHAGSYSLTATAIDGADNTTSKVLHIINVLPQSKAVENHTQTPVTAARVSVYVLDKESNNWQLWDGASYGQTNPQLSDRNGGFKLLLPSGTYYLQLAAKGHHKVTTDTFSLTKPTPLSTVLHMNRDGLKISPTHLLSWLDVSTKPVTFMASSSASNGIVKNSLIGQALPSLQLNDTTGRTVKSVDWLGKPTVLSVSATWLPTAAQQIQDLSQLQSKKDVNVEVVALQQNAGTAKAYSAISGYPLTWLADPDSTFSQLFSVNSMPTNYFIDRKGIVKKVIPGALTKQEILSNLEDL